MKLWDTSAILPLIFDEPHSRGARLAQAATRCCYAWSWLKVEACAALARRRASPEQWDALSRLLEAIHFIDIPAGRLDALCQSNREWRLRATDAGHLFCFQLAAYVIPEMEFVCFDDEIVTAASKAGMRLWSPPSEPMAPLGASERTGRHGRGKR